MDLVYCLGLLLSWQYWFALCGGQCYLMTTGNNMKGAIYALIFVLVIITIVIDAINGK